MTNHTPRSPHRSRRTLVRGIAAASAIAVALSLAASTGAAQWQALHEVEPLDADHVVLHLNGLVANHEPQGYRSRSEELPIELLIPEGSEVSPGDELLAVNAKVAETWSATRRLEIQ